jgi:hypothetical protein
MIMYKTVDVLPDDFVRMSIKGAIYKWIKKLPAVIKHRIELGDVGKNISGRFGELEEIIFKDMSEYLEVIRDTMKVELEASPEMPHDPELIYRAKLKELCSRIRLLSFGLRNVMADQNCQSEIDREIDKIVRKEFEGFNQLSPAIPRASNDR